MYLNTLMNELTIVEKTAVGSMTRKSDRPSIVQTGG